MHEMMMWDEPSLLDDLEVENDDDFVTFHSSLTLDDLEASGEATRPLEFPMPTVFDAELTCLTASDHRTGVEYSLKNVLMRTSDANTAYLIKKKLAKSCYGWVKLGVVLKRVIEANNGVEWQSTGDFVAVKCSSWDKIQSLRGRHLVDPIKEISVLQLIGNSDSSEQHVMGCLEVLQTEEHLYSVMPYYSGGELYGKLDISDGLQQYPDEDDARLYFSQILKSLVFLQRKGICHRNICLENLHLDSEDNLVLLDSGLSLRVPYNDPCNLGGVTDVSEGTTRRLMKPQGQCGQLRYLAPEILEQEAFDGHATDLWAASITLFIMLVGVAPFSMALCSDKRFELISDQGGLKSFLESLEVSLSEEAVDLLQNLLWRNPRDRFTLADVLAHPWVLGERFPEPEPLDQSLTRIDSLKLIPLAEEQVKQDAPESPTSTMELPPQEKHERKHSKTRESFKIMLKFLKNRGSVKRDSLHQKDSIMEDQSVSSHQSRRSSAPH